MVEADPPVSRGIEQCPAKEGPTLGVIPVGQDDGGVERALGALAIGPLFREVDGAGTCQRHGKGEAFGSFPGARIREDILIWPFSIVPQLRLDVTLMLIDSLAEAPQRRPGFGKFC